MKPDEFEEQLQGQPLRGIPSEWRAEILSAARGFPASRPRASAAWRPWISRLHFQVSTLLWPSPRAWAGLAAIWLIVIAFNLAAHDARPLLASKPSAREQFVLSLKEQKQVLAELLAPYEGAPAVKPKAPVSRPRSQAVRETRSV